MYEWSLFLCSPSCIPPPRTALHTPPTASMSLTPPPPSLQGTVTTLHKLCEDCGDRLESSVPNKPLNFLIPKFIQLFRHQHGPIR